MGNFNRGDRRSGGGFNRGGFGGGRRFGGGRDGAKPVMHKAVCSECGANCDLPFKPTGDRPVFCSDCFSKQQDGGARPSRFGGDRRERPSRFEDKQMHDAVCDKCGSNCQVPFKPMAGKAIFCDNCFDKGGSGSKDSGVIMEQLKTLNAKIDKLIEVLAPSVVKKKTEKKEVKKEVAVKKVVKAEKKEKVAKTKTAAKKVVTKKVATKKKK